MVRGLTALLVWCGVLAAVWLVPVARADLYEMDYEGRAYGVLGLGRVTVSVNYRSDSYAISAALRSGGLFALFERTTLNASAFGALVDGMPQWRSYVLDHAYSAKRRQIRMTRTTDSVETWIEPNYRLWGDPPTTPAQQLASRDPLSSFLAMGVAVGTARQCAGTFPTFDGRFHYQLELSGGRVTRFDDGGFEGQVLRCRLRYIPVAGFERDDGGRAGRVPSGEMWFALIEGDTFAPPVRVSTGLPLGEVALVLRELRRTALVIEAEEPPP